MIVFIDDNRTPESVLGNKLPDDVIWIKEAWEAKNFLIKNRNEIEEIHFDHYLGDDHITGGRLFEHIVASDILYSLRPKWTKLKTIYLHSSDSDIVSEFINTYEQSLLKAGVKLVNNSQPF